MKKLTKKQKRDILRRAKRMYIKEWSKEVGMCYCIERAGIWLIQTKIGLQPSLYGFNDANYRYLQKIFPEFNSMDLAGRYFGKYDYWWPLEDTQSRIEAFKKLIDIYQ